MKNLICLTMALVLVLSLCACGGKQETKAAVDLQKVYESLQAQMPEMQVLDGNVALNLFGVSPDLCEQSITAICADGMLADEVWLIRAKDKAALEKLTELAKARLDAKAEESESYSPDQYAIVKKAETVTSDLYLALLVGPEAAAMKATVEAALK